MKHIFFLVFLLDVLASSGVVIGHLGETRRQVITLELFERTLRSIDVLYQHVYSRVVTLLGQINNLIKVTYACEQIAEPYQSATPDHGAGDSFELAAMRDFNHGDTATNGHQHLGSVAPAKCVGALRILQVENLVVI